MLSILDYYRRQKIELKYRAIKEVLDRLRDEIDVNPDKIDELEELVNDFYNRVKKN